MRTKRLLSTALLCLLGMFLIVKGSQFIIHAREITKTEPLEPASINSKEVDAYPGASPNDPVGGDGGAEEASGPLMPVAPLGDSESHIDAAEDYGFELEPRTVKQGGFAVLTLTGEGRDLVQVSTPFYEPLVWGEHNGVRTALLPIKWTCDLGEYLITADGGGHHEEFLLNVVDGEFPVQDLQVDTSITQNTINSNSANDEYMQKAQPVKSQSIDHSLWNGVFLRPVEGGWRSTEYGSIRYVNGVYTERHGGEDLAVAAGTPVWAANDGKVLFAEYLQLTGNTVCIEHGLGLKTWYYHMNELYVTAGQDVKKGDVIGLVGSTGFSTGAHLHFGCSIGTVWVDPELLLAGTVLPE